MAEKIFYQSIDKIKTQVKVDDGIEYWDLTTKDNFPVAYGVYIYHVDAGKHGKKIGRFALIK